MSTVDRLQKKSDALIARAQAHEAFRLLVSPPQDFGQQGVRVLLRNILLQSYYFGFHFTEAAFVAIGRFPKSKPQLIKAILDLAVDEVFHPELAAKDFVRMGGDPNRVDLKRSGVAPFVMGATCRLLAEREHPFAFLGCMALMESTTPVLTGQLVPILRQFGMATDSKFVPLHATGDIEHSKMIFEIIEKAISFFPDSENAIDFGFECLAQVYPGPIWDEALSATWTEVRCGDAGGRLAGVESSRPQAS